MCVCVLPMFDVDDDDDVDDTAEVQRNSYYYSPVRISSGRNRLRKKQNTHTDTDWNNIKPKRI